MENSTAHPETPQSVELSPKVDPPYIVPISSSSFFPRRPRIYADNEGTPKTDYVANWVIKPHYLHSRSCQLFERKFDDSRWRSNFLATNADYRCKFCGSWTIHCAVLFGGPQDLAILVNGGAELDSVNEQGETALHLACSEGNGSFVDYLLASGANPNVKDNSGTVPLHICVAKDDVILAELLLSCKANVDEPLSERISTTPLMIAVEKGYHDLVKLLMAFGANVMQRSLYDQSPTRLAIEAGHESILASLLAANKDCINERYRKGTGPLHVACLTSKYRLIKILLEAGAQVNAKDNERTTALHLVASSDDIKLAKLLQKHGCDINSQDIWRRTPLHLSILANTPEMAAWLLSVGATTERLASPFLKAVKNGECRMVRLLVENNLSVNVADWFGKTPLMVAAETGDLTMMEYLLKEGADPNAVSKKSARPMITEAIIQGNIGMIKLLLSGGADPRMLDSTSRSPMYHAYKIKSFEIIEVLLMTGIKVVMDEAMDYLLGKKKISGDSYDIEELIKDENNNNKIKCPGEKFEKCLIDIVFLDIAKKFQE